MLIFLTILIIVVTFVIVFLFYKGRKSGNLYNNIATLIQTVGAIWAIWFAIKSVMDNNELISESLIQVKKQDSISNITINELKSISGSSSKLKENFDTINNRMSKIPSQIDSISFNFLKLSNNISNFPSKIDSIANNLIKLNNIINEQKQLTELEINRMPILTDSNFTFDNKSMYFKIYNVGSISAQIDNVSISFFNPFVCIERVEINNQIANDLNSKRTSFQIYGTFLYEIYQNNFEEFNIKLRFKNDCVNINSIHELDIKIQLTYKTLNQRSGNYIFNKKINI
jgi:hypothetical protein